MKDKWMNIGCEDDELKPYVESEPELNDQRRIDALAALGLPRRKLKILFAIENTMMLWRIICCLENG